MIIKAAKVAQSDLLFSAPVTIAAAATEEGAAKGPRTFSMVAYTGGLMKPQSWGAGVVVDLKGMSGADKSRPVLHSHDPKQRVGHTTKIIIDGATLTASGVISGVSDIAKEIVGEADNGFPWQASIGARVINLEFVPEGSTAKANGQTFNGPINIARKTVLGEISFVSLGADDNTSARIAAHAAKGHAMNFEQWLEANGFGALDTLPEAQRPILQASFDAAQKAAKTPADTVQGSANNDDLNTSEAIKAHRAAFATENLRIANVTAKSKGFPEITAKAVGEGWDENKTELEVLRASRPTPGNGGSFSINTGAGANFTTEIVAAAAALQCNIREEVAFKGLNEQAKNLAGDRRLRAASSIYGLMSIVAAANGVQLPDVRMTHEVIECAFRLDQRIIQAADGFSTMSLSGITENIMNKGLLAAYGDVASVVSDIAYETDTNDFKQFKRYRLTASGAYAEVGPDGELKSMGLQDESYPNQVKTQGVIITITRQIMINDDMSALTETPSQLGRQGAIAREKAVFASLVGNAGSFFGTSNKNYLSGAGSVLGISGVSSAVQKFREMKDANGNPVLIMPDRLLVPPALEAAADNLFSSQFLIASGLSSTSSRTVEPSNNTHKGKYRPISSPFLGAAAPTAGSDTGWYLLGNPAGGMATVQVGYLRGQRTPIIERGELDFSTLGMALRSYFDFGTALHDPRTGVLAAGT